MKKIFICLIVFFLSTGNVIAQKAGKGTYEPRELKITGNNDNSAFIPRHHYIRIEVPKWFVNNKDDFLKKKIVSGTVEIKIGDEDYNAVLGTFPLSNENKISPVFNRALLDNRVYNGGDITLKVFIKGIKKDTAMGKLLKNLADTALNVAVGQVTTMTGLGTVPALNEASETLTAGVKESLNSGEEQYGIFEESGGLETTFSKNKIANWGQENFWLAYRGDSLNGKTVKVIPDGLGSYDINVDNKPLREGAWVLIRITRESVYGNNRPWRIKAEQVRKDLDRLMQDWRVGAKTQQDVQKELTATLKGDQLADRILALRSIIESDSVLSATEQGLETTKLITYLSMAQQAFNKPNGFEDFFAETRKFEESLLNGTVPTSEIAKTVLKQEFKAIAETSAEKNTDEFINLLSSTNIGSSEFLYSTSDDTTDVSLVNAEMSQSKLKSKFKDESENINKVVSLNESELWKLLSEIEREKNLNKAKEKKK